MNTPERGGQGQSQGADLPPAPALVERALAASNQSGCAVLVDDASEAEVRFANNTVTTNGVRRDRRVTVISFCETHGGISTGMARQGGDVDVVSLVRAAEADAAGSPPATDAFSLVKPDQCPAHAIPGEPEAPPATTDLSVFAGILPQLGGAFARAQSAGRVLAGFAEHQMSTSVLGTSGGLLVRHVQPTGALHLVARDRQGQRSAWSGVGTTDFEDLAVEELEDRLLRRFEWSKRRMDLAAGRYEVLLPPDAVADLMVIAMEAMSGRDAEEGRSVYSGPRGTTRIGSQLAPLPFELRSDPEEPGLACSPFLTTAVSSSDVSVFDNGLALGPTTWIRDGVLERLVYHRAGAARSGTQATPPVDNLVLELPGAHGNLDDMVARTERGLLLTCLWYIREVDPATLLVTGLTRDGVFLVEEGQVKAAVNNFRFNESPVDLLARVAESSRTERALGRELGEWFNRTAMPALRIPDFNMSSVSPAS